MSLKRLLCGVHKEDVEKNKSRGAKNKSKQREDSVNTPNAETEDQLIDLIPDSGLRERFRILQNERIQEEKERQCRDLQLRKELEEVQQTNYKLKIEVQHLQKDLDDKDKYIKRLKETLQDCSEESESTKKDLQATRDELNRLELMVSSLQNKPYVSPCQDDSKHSKLVEALGTLVVQLPKQQIETNPTLSQGSKDAIQEVKNAMRLAENFIGPRWQEFAREINLPGEIIENNELSTDQRKTEIYWRIMSEWQKREDVTVTKIATICQQLGINIYSDKPMSNKHKRLLEKNREKILGDIFPKHTLYHMLKYLQIPASLREYVTSSEKRPDMAEKLLDMLPVLGDEAFLVFYLALHNTGQQHIADLLMEHPMPEEHKLVLRKFENTVVRYSESHRVVSNLVKYLPGCIKRFLLEPNITRNEKMKRLLETLPCLGHNALDILINALDVAGCKQVSSILKDKSGELHKLMKKEVSTQISPEDVNVLAQEPKAPLTGHRRSAKSRDRSDSPDTSDQNEDEGLLWQDDYYAHEMQTKAMEANAAMFDISIEERVNMDYICPKPIEILNHMDRFQVRYRPYGAGIEWA
ncbi:uncharacterized protein LOC117329172 isoform X2 [Pecten maximus]|uniref:uncharacterized protein LOC117329172 isoform X2 n=1 Tax=Pecten maximus TaxID=6579 RepID=UPI001458F2DB|nr:uncharacterized protein LOC117329172 isoform X2 [Pecten maximus]